MKIRFLSILLALLMSVPAVMTGCSETPQENESDQLTTAESESDVETAETEDENFIKDNLGEADFGGYDFRMIANENGAKFVFAEEINGEAVNDELFYSCANVMDRFNVKITMLDSAADITGIITTTAAAMDNAFDVSIGHDFTTFGLGVQGYLYNIYDVPQFDFDMPWWTEDALTNLTIQGKLFAVSNYMSYAGLNMTRAIFINKDIAEEHNIEIPYDVVRAGDWTYDKFGTYLEGIAKDLDGNGLILENDRFAFSSGYHAWYCMQEAADISVYHHDKDGNLYFEADQEKIVNFVEKLQALTKKAFYYGDDAMGEKVFNEGRSLFCYAEIGLSRDKFVGSETVYGFLPTPKMDEFQTDYINCCTDKPWAISVATDDDRITIIGTVCEALSCLNYNNVIPAFFEGAMQARMADAPDDSEMLQIIRDTRTIGFAYAYNLELNNIFNKLGQSAKTASFVAKYSQLAEKSLEDLIAKVTEIQ